MKQHLKLLPAAVAAFLVFCLALPPAVADSGKDDEGGLSLETIMLDFMADRGLDDSNFAFGYYNTATGEQYYFNEDTYFKAGSTYKLALNMYYTELINSGEMSWDDEINGHTLAYLQEQSLVYSNNELSMDMVHALMNGQPFSYYRTLVAKYADMDDLDYIYYVDNYVCAEYLLKTVKYLYDHAKDFPTVIGYLKQAQPDAYFAARIDDYEVAHKYGLFEGAFNDVGIIYTPTPFLLTVLTYNLDGAEQLLGEIAEMMAQYTVYVQQQTAAGEAAQTPTPDVSALPEETTPSETVTSESADITQPPDVTQPAVSATAQPDNTNETQPPDRETEKDTHLIWLVIPAGFAAVGVLIFIFALSKRGKHVARRKSGRR